MVSRGLKRVKMVIFELNRICFKRPQNELFYDFWRVGRTVFLKNARIPTSPTPLVSRHRHTCVD